MNKLSTFFKRIAYAEGTSFLILLCIGMPLKYVMGQPMAVKYFGWIHGVLFIVYIFAAFQLAQEESWPFKKLATALVAAVLPFGPFVLEKRYL